jgi:hypothetical protein
MLSRRVEDMARELEALRNQRYDGVTQGTNESPSLPESSHDSPDHPSELFGIAMLDASDLDEQYELEDCVIARETVVEIFKL